MCHWKRLELAREVPVRYSVQARLAPLPLKSNGVSDFLTEFPLKSCPAVVRRPRTLYRLERSSAKFVDRVEPYLFAFLPLVNRSNESASFEHHLNDGLMAIWERDHRA